MVSVGEAITYWINDSLPGVNNTVVLSGGKVTLKISFSFVGGPYESM